MENLREGLDQIFVAIKEVADRPSSKPTYVDNELSGDLIHGGTISQFRSTGIADDATKKVLVLKDEGVHTDKLFVSVVATPIQFQKDVSIDGKLTVQSLKVNELSADIRQERTSPLEFIEDENNTIYGKGLIWRSTESSSKQLIYQANPDRLYSTEIFDLDRNAHFSIGNSPVLSKNELGSTVRKSSLTTVGTLQDLHTNGNLTIDEFVFYNADSQRIGIGTDAPQGNLSIASLDAEFYIDVESNTTKLGNWTNNDLQLVTDNIPRITVSANGQVLVGSPNSNNARLNVFGKLGIGVNNVSSDVDVSINTMIELAGNKIFYTADIPATGNFTKGDIAYNSDPKPSGNIGWVCVRDGTPGEWRTFGNIAV